MSANLLLFLLLNEAAIQSIWISPPSKLPVNNSRLAVGSYNDNIFIFGGFQYTSGIMQYQITTDTFNDLGEDMLTTNIYGEGQFWIQKEEILYMIRPNGWNIATFDMENMQYQPDQYALTSDVDDGACLAASNDHLFVVGGDTSPGALVGLNTLQVLNIQTDEWIENAPSMQQPRTNHACIVHNDIVWVFGGVYNSGGLKTNEYIQINNIVLNAWVYIAELQHRANGLRVISYEDYIYIMGGQESAVHDTMHMYNVVTNEMILLNDRLSYPVRNMATIFVNNIIYHFGGYRSYAVDGRSPYGITNQWMYYEITFDPTVNPIIDPTMEPIIPSQYPSIDPSEYQFETTILTSNLVSTNAMNVFTKVIAGAPVNVWTVLIIALAVLIVIVIIALVIAIAFTKVHLDNIELEEKDGAIMDDVDQIANDDDMVDYRANTVHLLRIRSWLETDVNLAMYYDNFINNGYDTLNMVKAINDEEQLMEIGILLKAHRLCILDKVERLNVKKDGPITNDVGQIINDADVVDYRRYTVDLFRIKSWLETDVNLAIYYDIFINNGYDTLNIVKAIDDEKELIEIGILSKEHRLRILNEVQKLKVEVKEGNVDKVAAVNLRKETKEGSQLNLGNYNIQQNVFIVDSLMSLSKTKY